jgi:hypothetical protein
MRVIVHDQDAVFLSLGLEAPDHARERRERLCDLRKRNRELPPDADRGKSVEELTPSWRRKTNG